MSTKPARKARAAAVGAANLPAGRFSIPGTERLRRSRSVPGMENLPAGRFAAPTAAALAFRAGFVDIQRSAANFMTVDCGNGPIALGVIAHFDKSKPSGLSGVAVGNDVHPVNRTMGFKQSTDVLLAGVKAEISYKNILHFDFSFWI